MVSNKNADLAWRIFTDGRKLHEWIFQLEHHSLAKAGVGNALSEFSFAQMRALRFVKIKGRVSISELAELLNVSAPSASAMVERLVEKGVLLREPDPADRRRVIVTVTPDLAAVSEKIEKEIFGAFVDLVDRVGPELADDWCRIVGRIATIIENEMEPLKD